MRARGVIIHRYNFSKIRITVVKVSIITNPNSGRGQGPARAVAITDALLRRGHDVEVHAGKSREDAQNWAQAKAADSERLVVVGGDGSMSAILPFLPDNCPPIMLAPLGTGNVLAKELEIPQDPNQLAILLDTGRIQNIDIAKVGERRSFMVWGFGFDGELTRRLEEQRQGAIRITDYLPLVIKTLMAGTTPAQRVIADGKDLGEFAYGIITNIRSYGNPILKLGPTSYDDGKWELYLLRNMDVQSIATAAGNALIGRLHQSNCIVHASASHVEVHGEQRAPYQVDGDYAGSTPVNFQVDGFQIPLVVPNA